MPLNKQSVNVNFAQGIDTKTDPFQIPFGRFSVLNNSVLTKGGRLQKRNGFPALTALPNSSSTYTTTFNGNLTAIGTSLEAYASGSKTWVNKGSLLPVQISTLPLVRNNNTQLSCDAVVSPISTVCTAYTETFQIQGSTTNTSTTISNIPSTAGLAVGMQITIVSGSGIPAGATIATIASSTSITISSAATATHALVTMAVTYYKYTVADDITGQNLIAPVILANATGAPKTFLLGNYFIVMFTATISGTPHLQYIPINYTTLVTGSATDISTTYTPASTGAFDAYIANNTMFVAWNGSDGGGAIRVTYIDSTLTQHGTAVFTGKVATIMSVTADVTGTTPVIYVSFYNSGSSTGFTLAVNQILSTILSPTSIISSGTVLNITSAAQNSVCTFFYEVQNAYSYDSSIPTNFVQKNTITVGGSVGIASTLLRSVGLASKAFISEATIFVLVTYSSSYQSTYFLTDSSGNICAKLAYSNGGGYLTTGLPCVNVSGALAQISYLFQDQIEGTNKAQAASNGGKPVFAELGINLANFQIYAQNIVSNEIGSTLNISGGFLWSYDGYNITEQNFFVWPDNVELTTSGTGGFMSAQQYFYQVVYEWADNQGNINRSAPSIPVTITTTGTTSLVTINAPTLRLTRKISTPIDISFYRWSAAQQNYYKVGSVLNSTTVDSVAFVDVASDSQILGNPLIYTTGGVVEDISPPGANAMALYKSRLVLVDSEDPNLLWYSKQVIEATPVEMSDLFTIYVAPTTSAQGNTGPITALSAMDDKLIIFKKDAIYYITGNGPDNTGANNDFSDPIFITSTVGCSNQHSIVFMPNGLMFQSDKGIWLLGRDLSTTYIGAAAEAFNSFQVTSAVAIPATNQVRFTLSNGQWLMYDYYYNQWGSFSFLSEVSAVSSTLFQDLHTYIDASGSVYQESPGTYQDGSNPVLMNFTTGWINLAGLQGYERAYFFTLLGTFLSPHKLTVQIGYDYAPAPSQQTIITPYNYNAPWGGDSVYGNSTPWGGTPSLEQWKVHLVRQQCQAFQISIAESYDSSYLVPAGAGLTMSGLDLVVGLKKGWRPIGERQSVG